MRSGMEHDKLPPLVEAVPEIRQTHPISDHRLQYSRNHYDSLGSSSGSSGSSQFPEARSLAPSPLAANRSRHTPSLQPQSSYESQNSHLERPPYATQNGHNSSSLIYPDYSIKRVSYTSTPISSQTSRHGSPILLPAPRQYITNGSASTGQGHYNQANLPLVHGNGSSNGSYTHSSRPAMTSQHAAYDYYSQRRNSSPPRQLLLPPYGGVQHPEYSYSTGSYYDRSPFSTGGNGSYATTFDAISDHGDGKQKRRRGNLPKAVTDTLRVWFTEHIAHPYPTEEEKQILMSRTGLTISQISNWFINARRRSLPQMTKQAQTEAGIRDGQGVSTGTSKLRA